MNQLAIITGASSGIGKALAFAFSKRNFNLVLIARRLDVLNEIKSQIEKETSSKVKTISCDLSKIEEIKKLATTLESDFAQTYVLVNNAGIGCHGNFEESPLESEIDLATIQVQATLILTKTFLKFRNQEIKSQILNIASVYSFVPVPFQAVYGACKAFLYSFGDALANEGHKNFSVTTVFPGSTRTEFRIRMGIQKKKISGMSPERVADLAVEGLLRNKKYIVTGGINKFFVFLMTWLPRSLAIKAILKINSVRGVN